MQQTPLSATPLNEISIKAHGKEALAAELGLRIADGREQEVIAYLRDCNRYPLLQVATVAQEFAVWRRSPAMWLAFARLTVPRRIMFPEPYEPPPRRDAAFSQEMRALADNLIADSLAAGEENGHREAMRFVLSSILQRLPYQGMPQDAVRELFRWNKDLREASGSLERDDVNLTFLARFISDTDELIALAGRSDEHFLAALWAYEDRTVHLSLHERWLPWHDFFRRHPDHLDWQHYAIKDAALIAWRWPHASPDVRGKMAHTLLETALDTASGGNDAEQAALLGTIDRLIRDDEAAFATLMARHGNLFSGPVATLIREKQYPGLLPSLSSTSLADG